LITLALTCHDQGDRDRPRRVLAHLADQAPGLMIEVVHAAVTEGDIGETLAAADALARLSDDVTRALLERTLTAMRGNRSASCLTFVDASNRLRVIPPNGAYRFVNQPEELQALRSALTSTTASPPS
jgi:hypothetical protein